MDTYGIPSGGTPKVDWYYLLEDLKYDRYNTLEFNANERDVAELLSQTLDFGSFENEAERIIEEETDKSVGDADYFEDQARQYYDDMYGDFYFEEEDEGEDEEGYNDYDDRYQQAYEQ